MQFSCMHLTKLRTERKERCLVGFGILVTENIRVPGSDVEAHCRMAIDSFVKSNEGHTFQSVILYLFLILFSFCGHYCSSTFR